MCFRSRKKEPESQLNPETELESYTEHHKNRFLSMTRKEQNLNNNEEDIVFFLS